MGPLHVGSVRIDLEHRWVERDGERERLTSLEADLLRYLAEAGRTVGRDELLAEVWKYAGNTVTRACDTTIRRLRTKLEDDPANPEILLTVHGTGYRLVRESTPTAPSPTPPPAPERTVERRFPCGDHVIDLDRVRVETPDGPVPLTANEVSVLEVLLASGGAAIDRQHLQRRIWGTTTGRPLDNTIGRLRRKIEADPANPRVLRTTATGYRLDVGAEPPEPGPIVAAALPHEVDRRFGRDDDVERVVACFAAGDRLVTLTGPGGVGKTRLALGVARSLPSGATWVDATLARSLDALYTAIALALRARVPDGEPLDHLARVLGADADRVLVLDNLEQIPDVATAVSGLLERAPGLRILTTSRVLLRTRGERRIVVQPLSVGDAVDLFVDRAVRPPTDDERPDVVALVEALDRLPLAIELAAARTGVLTVAAIRERTRERLQLLASADPQRPKRHRSLRASLDGSWELTDPWTRAALAQLTVFEGGFTVDAAEQILDLSAWSAAIWTLDVLQELVDTSLLRVDPDGRRFVLLEVVRAYAAEQLSTGDRAATEVRHGRYFGRRVEGLDGAGEIGVRTGLVVELPNLRAALERAVDRGDAEVAVGAAEVAFEVWWTCGPYGAAVERIEDALRRLVLDPGRHARLVTLAGKLRTALGHLPAAERHLHAATALAREASDPVVEADARCALAMLYHRGSKFDEALIVAEEARDLARRSGAWWAECRALAAIGAVHQQLFRLDLADEHLLLAHRIAIEHRAIRLEVVVLRRLGGTALMRGRVEQARERFEAARAAAVDCGDLLVEAWLLLDLAQVHRQSGRSDLAEGHATVAAASLARIGDRLGEGIAQHAVAWDRLNRGALDGIDGILDQALLALRACGSKLNECLVLNTLGGVALERGQLGRAREAYQAALEVAREIGDAGRQALVRSNLGWIACLQGASAEGLAELEASVAGYRGFGNRVGLGGALVKSADALADLDRLDEAEVLAREALEIGEAEDRGLVRRASTTLAILAARRGELDTAAERVAALNEPSTGIRTWRASMLHAKAELAFARGDRASAADALEEAAALASPVVLGARFRALRAAVRE